MNKNDISSLRKEFKVNGLMLKVKELRTIYLKKDNFSIIHSDFNYFEKLDLEKQELYLNNCKKILTGSLDKKLFELDFIIDENKDSTQNLLLNVLRSGDQAEIQTSVEKLVEKIASNFTYENDVVISIYKTEYWKGVNKKYEDSEESLDDYMNAFEFLLVSINKVENPKMNLIYDYTNRQFIVNSSLDSILNLNSPLEGFLFPTFTKGYSDVNKVLYHTSKTGHLNQNFVDGVLNCNKKLTAQDEKECFTAIVNYIAEDGLEATTLHNIYEKINDITVEVFDDGSSEIDQLCEENNVVDLKTFEKILNASGIENTQRLENAFEEVCGKDYEFKINNILPEYNSKSIKIKNENTNITITPKDLKNIRQIVDENGKKCLLIELTEDIVIEGFKIKAEDDLI